MICLQTTIRTQCFGEPMLYIKCLENYRNIVAKHDTQPVIRPGRRFVCDYDVLKVLDHAMYVPRVLFSTGKLRSLEEQYSSVVMTVQEQKQLIAQLEEDLRSVNALSTMFRPDAEGEASVTSSSAEFVADAVRELNQACNSTINTSPNSFDFT